MAIIDVPVHNVQSTGLDSKVQFKVTENSTKLFSMLSTSLYKDKERAVLTELCSNALDAHAMVGKHDLPIRVVLPINTYPHLTVRDFGPGMSEEQVVRFLTTYGESSKQDSNEFIGGYGIGSKSPMAVTSVWNVKSYYNGVMTEYVIMIERNGTPTLSKLYSIPTDETGLEVSIPVGGDSYHKWQNSAKHVFFPYKVKPELINHTLSTEYLDYSDFDKKVDCIFRENVSVDSSNHTDVVINNRVYALDTQKCGIKNSGYIKYMFFKTGQLSVSLSREELQYDTYTINKIVERYNEVKKHIKRKLFVLNDKYLQVKDDIDKLRQFTFDNYTFLKASIVALQNISMPELDVYLYAVKGYVGIEVNELVSIRIVTNKKYTSYINSDKPKVIHYNINEFCNNDAIYIYDDGKQKFHKKAIFAEFYAKYLKECYLYYVEGDISILPEFIRSRIKTLYDFKDLHVPVKRESSKKSVTPKYYDKDMSPVEIDESDLKGYVFCVKDDLVKYRVSYENKRIVDKIDSFNGAKEYLNYPFIRNLIFVRQKDFDKLDDSKVTVDEYIDRDKEAMSMLLSEDIHIILCINNQISYNTEIVVKLLDKLYHKGFLKAYSERNKLIFFSQLCYNKEHVSKKMLDFKYESVKNGIIAEFPMLSAIFNRDISEKDVFDYVDRETKFKLENRRVVNE